MWRLILLGAVILGWSVQAAADEPYMAAPPGSAWPPPAGGAGGSPVPWPSMGNPPLPPQAWPPPAGGTGTSPALAPGMGNMPLPPQSWPPPAMQEAISVEKLVQSSWYAEVDYFHWNERLGSVNLVKESGALYTLGYTRQMGAERFRMELFGGNMRYDGYLEIQMPDGSWENEPLGSTTRYLGARGEYEYLLRASSWSDGAFILGLGNRVWVRDLRDATGAWGDYSYGYEETWWTIYPYLGLEAKRPLGNGLELFSSARVGATLITISKASIMDEPVWPKCGVEAQCEFGLRGPALSASAYCEVMTWSRSSVVDDYTQGGMLQPNSQMLTVGGKFGLAF